MVTPLALRSAHDGACVVRRPAVFGRCDDEVALYLPNDADDLRSLLLVSSPSSASMPGEFRQLYLGPPSSRAVCADRWCLRCVSRDRDRVRVGLCAYHGYEPIQVVSAAARTEGGALLAASALPQGSFAFGNGGMSTFYLLSSILAILVVASSRRQRWLVNHFFAAQADASHLRVQLRQIRDAHRPLRTRHVLTAGGRFYVFSDRGGDGRESLGGGALAVWMYLDADLDALQIVDTRAAGRGISAARFSPRRMQEASKASKSCHSITPSSGLAASRSSPPQTTSSGPSRNLALSFLRGSPSSGSIVGSAPSATVEHRSAPPYSLRLPPIPSHLAPSLNGGDDGARTHAPERRSRRALEFPHPDLDSHRSQSSSDTVSPSRVCAPAPPSSGSSCEQPTAPQSALQSCVATPAPSATASMGRPGQITVYPRSVARISFATSLLSNEGDGAFVSRCAPDVLLRTESRGRCVGSGASAQEIDSLYPWRCITLHFHGLLADHDAVPFATDQLSSLSLTLCAESDRQAVETFLAVQEWLHLRGQLADKMSPGSLYWARVRLRLAIRSTLTGARPMKMLARAFQQTALQRDSPASLAGGSFGVAIRIHDFLLNIAALVYGVAAGVVASSVEVGCAAIKSLSNAWSRPRAAAPTVLVASNQVLPMAPAPHVVYRL